MIKWGLILVLIGAAVAVLFVFLPLYAPENGFSAIYITPLLCRGGETYDSDTVFGTGINDAPTASLNAYCVSASGERRDVSDTQVLIGLVGGGVPFIMGAVIFLLARFVGEFKAALRVNRKAPSPFNPTNPVDVPGDRALSAKLAEVDAAYSSRRISRSEYESLRKKIIDESNF